MINTKTAHDKSVEMQSVGWALKVADNACNGICHYYVDNNGIPVTRCDYENINNTIDDAYEVFKINSGKDTTLSKI